MNTNSVTAVVLATWLVVVGLSGRTAAQDPPAKPVQLPQSAQLSDVQIEWQSGGGDGCPGDCSFYRITLRGDGLVTLDDLGWYNTPPKAASRRRSIPADDVIALINQMFDGRFMSLRESDGVPIAFRKGELLSFGQWGPSTGPWVDLTLRVGAIVKTVRLMEKAPADLLRVRDRIWEIGGPKAWP